LKKKATAKTIKTGSAFWWIALVILCVFIAYKGSTGNGFTNLDDDLYILQNPIIQTLDGAHIKQVFSEFYLSNYHPLTTLSYMLEYRFFGAHAKGYHSVNLLLHLLNMLLVYLLAFRLTGRHNPAVFASLLFAVHPMHVESVAWISERKDVLYAFFYLSSALLYLKYVQGNKPLRMLLICLLLFACSLLSKSMAVTFPLLMLLIDFYCGRKMDMKSVIEKIPFFLLSVLMAYVAIRAQQSGHSIGEISGRFGVGEHLLIVCYALFFYITHLFVPLGLSAMHYYPQGALPWYYFAAPLILAGIVFIVYKSKGEKRRLLLYASLFFLISMLPVLQIIPVGNAFAAERYTYLSYTGFFILAGAWISGRNMQTYRRKMPVYIGTGLWIAWLVLLCHNRISVWKDSISLSSDLIAKNPDVFHGYLLRGCAKNDLGNYKEALADLNMAVQLKPGIARTYLNRGIARRNTGDANGAIKDYDKAIEMEPTNSLAWNNRGNIYAENKNYKAADRNFSQAIELDASNVVAYNNRGNARLMMQEYTKASEDYKQVIKMQPTHQNSNV